MGVEIEHGFMYIKSRDYVALKFMELEQFRMGRDVLFSEKPMADGRWCLTVKGEI